MAFNLFQNILQSPVDSFLWKKKESTFIDKLNQPAPVAPRTSSYTQPTAPVQKPVEQPKKALTLFADEQNAYDAMKQDWLWDDEAFWLVKQRREQMVQWLKLTPIEVTALKQMANDGLSTEESLSLLAQWRNLQKETAKSDFEEKYAKWNILQKGAYQALSVWAWNLNTLLKYGGNVLDFATFGKAWFGEDVKAMQEVTQSPEFGSAWFKVGKVLPDIAMAVAPVWTAWVATKWLAWAVKTWAKIGATYWAIHPILQKWSEAWVKDIATWAIVWGAIWGAIPIAWKAISKAWWIVKKSWKALYKTAIKPTAQEARQIISTEAKLAWSTKAWAKKIKMPVTRADTALEYGITGTEKGIAVKWQIEANKIFKKVITPALKKSKAEHSIDDIFTKVEQQIAWEKSALRKKELMEWLSALKEDYLSTGKKTFTTADLQAEKSMLDEFTPTKIFKWKEVSQGYNQVKNTLANIMREQVRTDLSKVWVKNAQKLYKDYANLSALEDIGVRWITEWGLQGWFGTFWSTVYDKIATPVKTVWGKYIYKLWNWVEYVWPKWMDTLGKYLKSKWYKVVGWNIINLSKNGNAPLIRGTVLSTGSGSWMD
jgi:hypothetical protein